MQLACSLIQYLMCNEFVPIRVNSLAYNCVYCVHLYIKSENPFIINSSLQTHTNNCVPNEPIQLIKKRYFYWTKRTARKKSSKKTNKLRSHLYGQRMKQFFFPRFIVFIWNKIVLRLFCRNTINVRRVRYAIPFKSSFLVNGYGQWSWEFIFQKIRSQSICGCWWLEWALVWCTVYVMEKEKKNVY